MTAKSPESRQGATSPLVTIAVPSLNQGGFIGRTLSSILAQSIPVRIHVLDAGSTDQTLAVLDSFRDRLDFVRSHPDGGQAAAINEGLELATTPYVTWLNADDEYLEGALEEMVKALEKVSDAPFAYGRTVLEDARGSYIGEYRVRPWDRASFARRCFISQPATLIRTAAWRNVRGLDARLDMALDYDLWWRLAETSTTSPVYVDRKVALARYHPDAKTMSRPVDHYREAMDVVKRHYGKVPLWWWLKMPASIGARRFLGKTIGHR